MAIQNKVVENDALKQLLEAVGELNKVISIPATPIDALKEDVLYGDTAEILRVIKQRIQETFTESGTSKLTEAQTIADLTEAWITVKLLKSIHVGISSRDKLLGITK